jgi:unsaturated chondroitin disaccharide hydrolase
MNKSTIFICTFLFSILSLSAMSKDELDCQLNYCATKVSSTLNEMKGRRNYDSVPWHIIRGKTKWDLQKVNAENWTSGFWAGLLWYDYEATGNKKIKQEAENYTQALAKILERPVYDHDLGFLLFCANGNAYQLTGEKKYKDIIIRGADSLATLFNPRVGTLLSWPREIKPRNWPHNTIMDNMINLEILFRAAQLSGKKYFYDIAVSHADVTMKNQFRKDYTSYHVAVYDTIDGHFIKGVTHQGYADNTMWARGQSWAIYGFTMVYAETKNPKYLDFVQHVADVYIKKLPEDMIPYWDFDDPQIPNAPKDASAACVAASALIRLSTFLPNRKGAYYLDTAKRILRILSTNKYQSRNINSAMLLHSTGNLPTGSEIDASII